jgi:type IV secretory pathway VirB10-like protein
MKMMMIHKVCVHIFQFIFIDYLFVDNTMENDEKQKTKTSSTVENHPPQTTTSSTEENHPPQTKKHDEISATRSCSCSRPHDSFPGIDHYFKIDNHQPSSTSAIKKTSTNDHAKPSTKSKRITHTDDDESEKEYDDDNDVVTNDTPANS